MPVIGGFLYVMHFLNFYTLQSIQQAMHAKAPHLYSISTSQNLVVGASLNPGSGFKTLWLWRFWENILNNFGLSFAICSTACALELGCTVLEKSLVTIYTIARQALHEWMQQKPVGRFTKCLNLCTSEDTSTMEDFMWIFWTILASPLLCVLLHAHWSWATQWAEKSLM